MAQSEPRPVESAGSAAHPSLGSAKAGSDARIIILKLWVPVGYQDGAQHRRAVREQAGGHSCCVVHGRKGRIVIVGANDNAWQLAHWLQLDVLEDFEDLEIEIDPPVLHVLPHEGGASEASEDEREFVEASQQEASTQSGPQWRPAERRHTAC